MLCDVAQAFGATFHGRAHGFDRPRGDDQLLSGEAARLLWRWRRVLHQRQRRLPTRLRSLRMHGQGVDRYEHPRIGLNSRLDTIQAAILLEKLKIFPDEMRMREPCRDTLQRGSREQPHPHACRDRRRAIGLGAVHDPGRQSREAAGRSQGSGHPDGGLSIRSRCRKQRAYAHFPSVPTPNSEKLSECVVSLPMHPYLDEKTQDRIIEAVLKSARRDARRRVRFRSAAGPDRASPHGAPRCRATARRPRERLARAQVGTRSCRICFVPATRSS